MALGEKLCNARLALKQTTSEVAAATHMKVQTVEDIEREDFRRIPAAIYAKGFIKLYAEHVGLDPQPLLNEYTSRFAVAARRGALQPSGAPRARILERESQQSPAEPPQEEPVAEDLFDRATAAPERGAPEPVHFDPDTREGQRAERPRKATGPGMLAMGRDFAQRGWQSLNRILQSTGRTVATLWQTQRKALLIGLGALIAVAVVILAIIVLPRTSQPSETVPPATETDPGEPHILRLAVEPADPYID